jgi:hypothetical protein
MGDKAGDDRRAVNDPLTRTDVKPSRAEFDGRKAG